jgi:hypothetical protein
LTNHRPIATRKRVRKEPAAEDNVTALYGDASDAAE